jgi:hypothetical protein
MSPALIRLSGLIFTLLAVVVIRLVPVLRRGRVVVLDRPKPCSLQEAQRAADRLISAGFNAEVVEHADNRLNMWANVTVAGQVRPDERYVLQVPRMQAKAAGRG